MLKKLINRSLRLIGIELCRLSDSEKQFAANMGWDISLLNYKDFQVARTIASAGHITIEEARMLSTLVHETLATDPIIEIGALFGYSTTVLTLSKKPSQKLITIDNFGWNPHGISSIAHKFGAYGALKDAIENHNVELIHQNKDEFYQNYDAEAPGLFFCDANHDHESTLDDLIWARDIGAKIICGHDYNEEKFPGVVQAVKEFGGPRMLVGSLFVL